MKTDLKPFETDIRDMKQAGHSIRDIAKNLSDRTNQKISSSAVFRFLKETASAKPETIEKADNEPHANKNVCIPIETPGAPIPADIIRFLDNAYGQKRVSRANLDFVVGHARATLQKRFGVNHAEASKIMAEYCKGRGWIFDKPVMKMKISFKNPEENHRRMWI